MRRAARARGRRAVRLVGPRAGREMDDVLDTVLQYRDMDASDPAGKGVTAVVVDTAPFTLLDTMTFSRVHYYFTMLSLIHSFVTDSNGMLRGVMTKDSLVQRITQNQPGAAIKRVGLSAETSTRAK